MPQISPSHTAAQLAFPLIPSPSLSLFALFVILSVWPSVTLAEVRVVTAQGEHRMGDRDTREDAIRLATEAAKRNALEQVADLPRKHHDRGRSGCHERRNPNLYRWVGPCPGARNDTTLDGDTIVDHDRSGQPRLIRKKCDQAIAALRENEDARHQLVALQQENDQLQQDLDAANQALAASLNRRARHSRPPSNAKTS